MTLLLPGPGVFPSAVDQIAGVNVGDVLHQRILTRQLPVGDKRQMIRYQTEYVETGRNHRTTKNSTGTFKSHTTVILVHSLGAGVCRQCLAILLLSSPFAAIQPCLSENHFCPVKHKASTGLLFKHVPMHIHRTWGEPSLFGPWARYPWLSQCTRLLLLLQSSNLISKMANRLP